MADLFGLETLIGVLLSGLLFGALALRSGRAARYSAIALCSGFTLACCLIPGNNDLLQADTLLGAAIVGTVGAAALGVALTLNRMFRPFLKPESNRDSLVELWMLWSLGSLAMSHAARSIALAELLPLIREDAVMTGLLMLVTAPVGAISAVAVRIVAGATARKK